MIFYLKEKQFRDEIKGLLCGCFSSTSKKDLGPKEPLMDHEMQKNIHGSKGRNNQEILKFQMAVVEKKNS